MEEEKNAMAPKAEQRQTVVMYPSFGAGHIIPMTELANVLLRRGLDVTIVLIERPFWSSDSGAATTRRAIAANPAITFHFLPPDPSPPDFAGSSKPPFFHTLQLLRRYNGELARFLRSFPRRRLHSVVTGMFSTYAAEIGVPAYTFFASGLGRRVPRRRGPAPSAARRQAGGPQGSRGRAARVRRRPADPGVAPREGAARAPGGGPVQCHGRRLEAYRRHERRRGEHVRVAGAPRCGGALRDPVRRRPRQGAAAGLLRRAHRRRRRGLGGGPSDGREAQRVPVVAGRAAGAQRGVPLLREQGHAPGEAAPGDRRRSGEIRAPVPLGGAHAGRHRRPQEVPGAAPEPDLEALLPAGFLERTHGRGLVVASWAPQAAVLRHPSAAAFVTHCGWNSVLEAVAAGVPMLCWPLYSEQMLNKVLMTDEVGMGMGIAVEMVGYAAGFVGAEEVERKVRLVMESEEGTELRKRVAARQGEAEAALREGGSSRVAFDQFLADVEKLHGLLGS